VTDDGRGFDATRPATGFGLEGMRERVALAGGTLDVSSAPGAGTVLEVRMPARRRDDGLAETAPEESAPALGETESSRMRGDRA
jgi:signal transduction histidine kinase